MENQKTIERSVSISGVGLHTGGKATITLCPAKAGSGIVFFRTDKNRSVPATVNHVNPERSVLSTWLGDASCSVQTVEHVLSAVHGMGIDNLLIEVGGPELPILDGSARPIAWAIRSAGVRIQDRPKNIYRLTAPFTKTQGEKSFFARPSSVFRVDYEVDFGPAFVQKYSFVLSPFAYLNEISAAKTFCRVEDLEQMRASGMAKGGTLDNALVLGKNEILNADRQTYENELVRHKILDFIGDMRLLDAPLTGHFIVKKGGHRFHTECLREMLPYLRVGQENPTITYRSPEYRLEYSR